MLRASFGLVLATSAAVLCLVTLTSASGCTYDFTLGPDALASETGASGGVTTCTPRTACKVDCLQGGCTTTCASPGACEVNCAGGNCNTTCTAGGACTVNCLGGNCNTTCPTGATCEVNCAGSSCVCTGGGCR